MNTGKKHDRIKLFLRAYNAFIVSAKNDKLINKDVADDLKFLVEDYISDSAEMSASGCSSIDFDNYKFMSDNLSEKDDDLMFSDVYQEEVL